MKIALLGDVALFGRFSLANDSEIRSYFKLMARYLQQFDAVVANLETPFVSDGKSFGAKSAYISSDPGNVEILRYLNIGIVNLANNHVYDYGAAGYESTLETLADADIDYFGSQGKQIHLESDHAKVALHGYCSYNTNPLGIAGTKGGAIDALDVATVQENIRTNHKNGVLNIVSVHSGFEHVNFPSSEDIRMARQFAEDCPYVYYGHHPHVVQGVEERKGALLAYSLGNFCFDDVYTSKSARPLITLSENNRRGLILELDIAPDNRFSYNLTPIYIGRDEMIIDSGGSRELVREYSDALGLPEGTYDARRNELIREYIEQRKALRNPEWYLKRLRFSSVELLARSWLNAYRYKRAVSRKLD